MLLSFIVNNMTELAKWNQKYNHMLKLGLECTVLRLMLGYILRNYSSLQTHCWISGGSAVGRWTCDLQVASSIPGRWLSRNIGQLSLASLRGR